MPRNGRIQMVGKREAREARERAEELAELLRELRQVQRVRRTARTASRDECPDGPHASDRNGADEQPGVSLGDV